MHNHNLSLSGTGILTDVYIRIYAILDEVNITHRKLGSGQAVNDRRSHSWTLEKRLTKPMQGVPLSISGRGAPRSGVQKVSFRDRRGAEKKKLLRLGRCLREEDSLNARPIWATAE